MLKRISPASVKSTSLCVIAYRTYNGEKKGCRTLICGGDGIDRWQDRLAIFCCPHKLNVPFSTSNQSETDVSKQCKHKVPGMRSQFSVKDNVWGYHVCYTRGGCLLRLIPSPKSSPPNSTASKAFPFPATPEEG